MSAFSTPSIRGPIEPPARTPEIFFAEAASVLCAEELVTLQSYVRRGPPGLDLRSLVGSDAESGNRAGEATPAMVSLQSTMGLQGDLGTFVNIVVMFKEVMIEKLDMSKVYQEQEQVGIQSYISRVEARFPQIRAWYPEAWPAHMFAETYLKIKRDHDQFLEERRVYVAAGRWVISHLSAHV
ncbi:hypothetical protein LXA43DRAFT_1067043 [Ganoderma leucocontextum]|nr:hypothetical protein LXA43DRAFT_1067043 [Ganoderma leucocontextum]